MNLLRKPMSILKLAAFVEGMAAVMLLIFVPYYVRATLEESSFTVISLLISLPALSTLVASNFWGALQDITGRYRLLTSLCLAGFCLCLLMVPVMKNAVSMIATVFGFSLLYGAVRPMLLTQATLLKERAKAKAISSIFFFESLGYFVGAFIHSQIYDPDRIWTGWIIFPAPGLLCLLAAILLLWKGVDPIRGSSGIRIDAPLAGRFFSSLINDFAEVYRNGRLRRLSMVVLAASTANFCFFGMYSMYFTEWFRVSSEWMSITLSLSTLIGMAAFPFAGRWVEAKGGRMVLLTSIAVWIADYSLYTLIRNPYLACVLFILPIYPFFLVSTNALAAEFSRSERRGGGLGALGGVAALSMAFGTVLGGATGDLLGLQSIPSISALVSGLAVIIFVLLIGSDKTGNKDKSP